MCVELSIISQFFYHAFCVMIDFDDPNLDLDVLDRQNGTDAGEAVRDVGDLQRGSPCRVSQECPQCPWHRPNPCRRRG